MRLTAYAGSSVALATGVLWKALNQRVNFYSACVYLSQSNACVIVLVNLLVLTVGLLVFGLQRLLYGPLRPIEAEQLYDRAWFAVTETCLAMTMFREEIGVWFILLFMSLLVGKAWAWIGEGRVEILDQQPPANPRLFHIRLSVSLFLSLLFDMAFLDYSVSTVRQQARPTMMVMFAFEFAVLAAASISTTLRYMISLRESAIIRQQTEQRVQEIRLQRQRERQEADDDVQATVAEEVDEADIDVPGWEDKGRWVFYLELLTGERIVSELRIVLTVCRPGETGLVLDLLLRTVCLLWPADLHYPRRGNGDTLVLQAHHRFCQIQTRHTRYERALSGRDCRGHTGKRCVHHLSRSHDALGS